MTETTSHALPAHSKIDKYEIYEVLGEGGFGITYRAENSAINKLVAIKEYLPIEQAVRNETTFNVTPRTNRGDDYRYGLNQFQDEGRRLARFSHPNIVRVVDFIEANGTAYLVMDFEEGESLGDLLKKSTTALPEKDIIKITKAILSGLLVVHKEGLLHRDIKPDNIYIRKNGEPLLIDFGSSRYALGAHSKSISAIISMGYAPPEQYSTHGKQGPQSDLYSVGATLYELITGKAPIESIERRMVKAEGEPDPLISCKEKAHDQYSDWLLALTDQLLIIPFKKRPSDTQSVLDALKQQALSQQQKLSESCKTSVVDNKKRWSTFNKDKKKEPFLDINKATRVVNKEQYWSLETETKQEQRNKKSIVSKLLSVLVLIGAGGWWYSEFILQEHDQQVFIKQPTEQFALEKNLDSYDLANRDLEAEMNAALDKAYGRKYRVVTDKYIDWDSYEFKNFVVPSREKFSYYPFIVIGDFDGDEKSDLAAMVRNVENNYQRLAILWNKTKKLTFHDKELCSAISFIPKNKWKSHWEKLTLKLPSDAILVECYETSSWILYWDGHAFNQYWMTD